MHKEKPDITSLLLQTVSPPAGMLFGLWAGRGGGPCPGLGVLGINMFTQAPPQPVGGPGFSCNKWNSPYFLVLPYPLCHHTSRAINRTESPV